MHRQITFCINTARNERFHLELLFQSLHKNLSRKDHEIIVYVENDNQDTVGFLKTQKKLFSDLRIIINPLPVPLDYGRNINLMFEMAKYPITSYIQSDMVIGPLYDLEVLKFLTPNTIVSSTRVEPPLHPPSPEKITHDFGLDPKNFDLDSFSAFAESHKKNRTTNFWFAPFTLYKKVWTEIGGHDTLFRRSRVDSDILYRLSLNGINTIQAWNAIVYHFTCTSSRGPEWWTDNAKQRTQLQAVADQIELTRFLRKWGKFKHPNTPEEVKDDYFYRISANFYNAPPKDISILKYYFMFNQIYISNSELYRFLKLEYDKFHNAANQLHSITNSDWEIYKKYYRAWEYNNIFMTTPVTDDVILDIDLNGIAFDSICDTQLFQQRQEIVHAYRSESPGEFELEGYNVKMTLTDPANRIKDNIKIENPPISNIEFIII